MQNQQADSMMTEFSLQDLIGFLLGNMRLLIAGLMLGALAGLLIALAQVPKFQSMMTLQFSEAKKSASSMQDMFNLDQGSGVNTAIPILQSRALAVDVVKKLALNAVLANESDLGFIKALQRKLRQWINPPMSLEHMGWSGKTRFYLGEMVGDPGPVGSLELRDLQVDPQLGWRLLTLKLKPAGIEALDESGKAIGSCSEGKDCILTLGKGVIRFFLNRVYPGHDSRIKMSFRSLDEAASVVRGSISAKSMSQSRANNFLSVSCQWPDPHQAAAILKVLAAVYSVRDKKEATRSYDQMLNFLDENLGPMEVSLERAEIELRAFLDKHNVLDMPEKYKQGLETIAGLDQQRMESEFRKRSLAYLADVLKKADPMSYGPLVSEISADLAKEWEQLQERSIELDIEKEALSGFSKHYPQMKKHLQAVALLDKRKDDLKQKALQSIQDKRKLLQEKDKTTVIASGKVEKGMGLESGIQNQYLKLTRNKAVAEKLYGLLLEKREEMRISKAGELASMQMLDAPLSGRQVSPNLPRSSILGGVLGLLLVGFIAFMRQTLDVAIRDADELERVGLYVHGMIPAHKEAEEQAGLVTVERPRSVDAEAYRSLRTSIQLSSLENQVRSIMITSSGPGEGKSTTMSNLAVTLAQAGKKTLVVDCDMRRPVAHKLLKIEREPGLAEVLEGKLDWHDQIKPTVVENLFVLPAGSIPANPSELIGRAHMGKILAEMKQEYDFILCDVPPILVVSDAALLASHLDGVLILVRSGIAISHDVVRAREQMERVGGKVLGAIFNAYSQGARGYGKYGYGKYGYGKYGYSGYYHQDEDIKSTSRLSRLASVLRGRKSKK
jgi:capsular exopolysaccharide synthesis family protein